MHRLTAVVNKEGRIFVAHCIELGVASQGKTIDGALKNLKEASELYLKHASREEVAHLRADGKREPVLATINVK